MKADEREWTYGDSDVRHQFLPQGGVTKHGVSVTFFGRLQPDMPYTPLVSSDVNGDGLVNDRALPLTQLDALEKAQSSYKALRAAFDSPAQYLAGPGDQYSVSEALRRQHEALHAVWELGHVDIKRTLPVIPSRIQLRMLPCPASLLYATPDNVKGLLATGDGAGTDSNQHLHGSVSWHGSIPCWKLQRGCIAYRQPS